MKTRTQNTTTCFICGTINNTNNLYCYKCNHQLHPISLEHDSSYNTITSSIDLYITRNTSTKKTNRKNKLKLLL